MEHLLDQWSRRIAAAKDGDCPFCYGFASDDGSEFMHIEGYQIYRGVKVQTKGDFVTADPIKLADAFKKVRYLGEHWTTDSNIAMNTFALPGPGQTGFFMCVHDWKCEDRVPVSPGYSHEKEIAFRPGAPMRLMQLRVLPDPDLRDSTYDKWSHDWNVQTHFGYDVLAGSWRQA